jgi:formylglycine-generating enzyme required for sulfatase activity
MTTELPVGQAVFPCSRATLHGMSPQRGRRLSVHLVVLVAMVALAPPVGRLAAAEAPPPSAVPAAATPVAADGACEQCRAPLPGRPGIAAAKPPAGMRWIPGGEFRMGAEDGDDRARPDERPQHTVSVHGYWMDETEVTNAQFAAFVAATGFVTTAERKPTWDELKQQVPPGTPRPDDALLVAGALVFTPPDHAVPLDDPSAWWKWVPGADWRHPRGPGSGIDGLERHPVVQISWDDAAAYAAWAGKRLPTEAEWEFAARGGIAGARYPWGAEPIDQGAPKANTFQGHFPDHDTQRDGFAGTAPVGSFPANGYGLRDMAGNVWEWCADWYRPDTYQRDRDAHPQGVADPRGPAAAYDPDEPWVAKRVMRGGSFLCHDSYCASYRVSARMKTDAQTALNHAGFRCVKSP